MAHTISSAALICLITLTLQSQAVKFPKDQRMDMQFPPDIDIPVSSDLPIGHLRPIGRQRPSAGEVTLGDSKNWTSKDLSLFRASLLKENSYNIWASENQKRNESRKVMIAKKHRDGNKFYQSMNLSAFLEDAGSEEWILEQILSKDLLADVKLPTGFECLTNNLTYIQSSLTSGLTSDIVQVSVLNRLQCVLGGRRDYIVMKNESTIPTITSKQPQMICGTEANVQMNPEIVNVFDNPWIESTAWNHATLHAGDCILLPSGAVFHTTSYGECETITFNWGSRVQCDRESNAEPMSLLPYFCADEDNKIKLCDCNSLNNAARWRQLLLSVLSQDGELTRTCVSAITQSMDAAHEVFTILGTADILESDIAQLSETQLEQIIKVSCPDEPKHVHDEL